MKVKTIKINFKIEFISIFAFLAVLLTLTSIKTYAEVGRSFNEMVNKYGQPQAVPLNKAISQKNFQKYEAKGIVVSSYKFQIKDLSIIALFNANDICYEMKTFNNRMLPPLKDLIGSTLAATKPVVLKKVWLRSITLQYGSGSSTAIYESFGLPGDLSVKVYSPTLKPYVP